jgi:short-subunit dehydrogenase
MDLKLSGKTALVTGSTAGIGYAIAKSLANEGVELYINGRDKNKIDTVVQKLKTETGNANINGIAADFSDKQQVESLIKQLPEVDILVNNIGIFEPKEFRDITDDDWIRFYEVNVLSGVKLSRAYLDKMLKKNWGRIIFI